MQRRHFMWAFESVFYQIYPLGFCGAPFENDGVPVNRIKKVTEWIPHLKKLGITAVYFSPVFESDTHGYNTRDYNRIDTRLGIMIPVIILPAVICPPIHNMIVVTSPIGDHAPPAFAAITTILAYVQRVC